MLSLCFECSHKRKSQLPLPSNKNCDLSLIKELKIKDTCYELQLEAQESLNRSPGLMYNKKLRQTQQDTTAVLCWMYLKWKLFGHMQKKVDDVWILIGCSTWKLNYSSDFQISKIFCLFSQFSKSFLSLLKRQPSYCTYKNIIIKT